MFMTERKWIIIFRGTSRSFQFFYFITSMGPALLLFSAKLLFLAYSNNQVVLNTVIILLGLVILLLISITFGMRKWLLYNYKNENFNVKEEEVDELDNNHIKSVNGNAIGFIISNITSVFLVQSYIIPSVLLFVLFQFFMFVLYTRGNTLLPNVLLILSGIDILQSEENNYFMDFHKDLDVEQHVSRIGDKELSQTYITNNYDF